MVRNQSGNASKGSVAAGKALAKRAKVAKAEVNGEISYTITRRKRQPLPLEQRTPDARFFRNAGIRTTRIVKLLNMLQNCANTDVYEYDKEQVSFMFHEIFEAYKEAKATFIAALANPEKTRKAYAVKKDRSIFERMSK